MTAEEEVAEVLARAKAEEDVARVLGGGQESPEDEVARVLAAVPSSHIRPEDAYEPEPKWRRTPDGPDVDEAIAEASDLAHRSTWDKAREAGWGVGPTPGPRNPISPKMPERWQEDFDRAASKVISKTAEVGAPFAGAALATAVAPYLLPEAATAIAPLVGNVVGGMAYRGVRHGLTPEPKVDPNLPAWAPKPPPGPTLMDDVLKPREMVADAVLGAAPFIGMKVGANFPWSAANPMGRKVVGGATAALVGGSTEALSDDPSLLGFAMRAVPSSVMGFGATGGKIRATDDIYSYGTAPTLDEAVVGTLEGRTPTVASVDGPRNFVGGKVEKLSNWVRNTIDRALPGGPDKAAALFRQKLTILADSGDPDAILLARHIAEMEGTQNRGKALFQTANAALKSQFSKDQLNQAVLLRHLMEENGLPMTAPAWLQGPEREAFDYIGELNDALARVQEGAGVRMPVTVPLEGQAPGLGSIPFQRRPNYGIPTYDASLVDPNQTPLQRALAHEQSATVRSKPIPDLPPDFRQSMQPDQLLSLFQRAARRVRSIGSQGLTQTTQQTRANGANPLLDFDEIYRIKIDRDAHHVAMARAFPGELRQMDLGDGRSLVIGESGEQMLLRLKQSNPHLFNVATGLLHELTVPNLSSGAKGAQAVSGFLSRGYLGRADISNMNQRTTTDWMLGGEFSQRARARWKSDPNFRRMANYGTAAGGTPRIATDMETRSLSGQLMQHEEGRLRGYESAGAILYAEDLSTELALKQAAGRPFTRFDTKRAEELGASPEWLASRRGRFSTQEAGQLLHDWTTLTQGSFEPGRMADIFTNPISRLLATQWRGFSANQAALVKRHIWDLMMDSDKDLRRLGMTRAFQFFRYQIPQAVKVTMLKQAMNGKLAIALKEETEKAKRDGVPMPELWGDFTKELLQGGLGFLGDAAILAGKVTSSAVHGATGIDTPGQARRGDLLRLLRSPAVEAGGNTLEDFILGDPGAKIRGATRLLAMHPKFPNFGPYAPMVGNLGEAAYDSVAKGE